MGRPASVQSWMLFAQAGLEQYATMAAARSGSRSAARMSETSSPGARYRSGAERVRAGLVELDLRAG